MENKQQEGEVDNTDMTKVELKGCDSKRVYKEGDSLTARCLDSQYHRLKGHYRLPSAVLTPLRILAW